jgi:hypothetical protein
MDKDANESASPWMPSVALDVRRQRLRTTESSLFSGAFGLGPPATLSFGQRWSSLHWLPSQSSNCIVYANTKGPRLSGVLHSRVI